MNHTASNNSNGDSDKENNCGFDFDKAELPVILTLTIIFNFFALLVLWRMRKTCRGVDFMMVCTLAVNDFVTTLLFIIMWVGDWMTCGRLLDSMFCPLFGWLATGMVIWSAWVIIIMAACRYLATVKPLYYRTSVTPTSVSVGLAATLVLTLVQIMFPFTGLVAPIEYYNENRICALNFAPGVHGFMHRALLGFLAVEGLVATCVIFFFNFRIIYEMRKKNKVHVDIIPGRYQTSNIKVKRSAFANVTKVVSVFYCLCYAPFLVRVLYDTIENTDNQDGVRHSVTMALLFLSPLLNPIVYIVCNKRYRAYVIGIFKNCSRHFKRNQQDAIEENTSTNFTLSTRT